MCGKIGHHAFECKLRKAKDHHQHKPQANLTESDIIAAVVSEANLVSNAVEWVVDTGATYSSHLWQQRFVRYL